jgi:hypothetical protein
MTSTGFELLVVEELEGPAGCDSDTVCSDLALAVDLDLDLISDPAVAEKSWRDCLFEKKTNICVMTHFGLENLSSYINEYSSFHNKLYIWNPCNQVECLVKTLKRNVRN